MGATVFVLRPEPGLSATLARGRKRGLAMEAMPLSHAEAVAWQVPEGAFDGILLGSANALRHAERGAGKGAGRISETMGGSAADTGLDMLPRLPVYAVGKATAQAACSLRFPIAQVVEGGLQKLLDTLARDAPLRLLRLAGEDRMTLSPPEGVTIETCTTYRIVHRALDDQDAARLREGGVVLLHSGVAARHFAAECQRAGVDRAKLSLAALAPRIASHASDGWKNVAVAPETSDAALLSLVADMCH